MIRHRLHLCPHHEGHAAGGCTQNNTCGGGAYPELQGFQCKGFNPEGQDLGTAGRCAANAYDNMGYLTLDFTCQTSVCKVDGDCPMVGSTCSPALSSLYIADELLVCRPCQACIAGGRHQLDSQSPRT